MSAAEPALRVNASRFRAAYEADWRRLERIITTIERHSPRALDDDDLLALPLLYRQALSTLSVARETSLDLALSAYLEQLCTRAYFQIYGIRTGPGRQLLDFFRTGWPAAVRGLWRETLAAVLLMLAGAIVGYILVTRDASWFYDLIPTMFADQRNPAASAETLRETLYHREQAMLGTFATFLFTHNAQVAMFAFALGFAFGLPTALLLIYNGVMVGAFFAVYVPKGLGVGLGGWLMIHGTTELFAIAIGGAAGFRIGTAVAFPGRAGRLDAAMAGGRQAAVAMMGVVLMLAVAGILEGVGRQTVLDDGARYLIAGTVLACWLAYFYLPRGRRAAVA